MLKGYTSDVAIETYCGIFGRTRLNETASPQWLIGPYGLLPGNDQDNGSKGQVDIKERDELSNTVR